MPVQTELRKAAQSVVKAEEEFRSMMPADWEGDPITDAVAELRAALATPAQPASGLLAEAVKVPDGWQLVPKEPTEAMLDVYWHQSGESKEMRSRTHSSARYKYAALLSAAPAQPESRAVPEGWQLVPLAATEEMESAAVRRVAPYHDQNWYQVMPKDLFRLAWPSMLSAAPVQPVEAIKAAQITMGRGLVDVTTIAHEGRTGILFRPRDQHIPVGEPGELQSGEYWPVEGDVVIWIENEGGASVIEQHLKPFLTAQPVEAQTQEKVVGGELQSLHWFRPKEAHETVTLENAITKFGTYEVWGGGGCYLDGVALHETGAERSLASAKAIAEQHYAALAAASEVEG